MSDHRQRISRLPILLYHAIAPFPSLISIRPQTFTRQIEFLHNQGYHILPLLEAIDALQTGDGLPERALVLTFDDGFEGVYQHAFPVLTRYGYPATVFLVTGYCGKQNEWPGQPKDVPSLQLMSWEHIREMDRYGIEFGAHTVTHPRLDQLIDSQASHEVLESQEIIQDHLAG